MKYIFIFNSNPLTVAFHFCFLFIYKSAVCEPFNVVGKWENRRGYYHGAGVFG